MSERTPGRREDHRLITGQGQFVDDIRLDKPLYVTFVRSMTARGTIMSVDVEEARNAPGIVGVFTGADVAGLGNLSVNEVLDRVRVPEFPVLASGVVNAVGQPVVAIISGSPHDGADAADMVFVDIQDEKPQLSIDPGAQDVPLFQQIPENAALFQEWKTGQPDEAFAAADHVVDVAISHSRLAPSPLETRAVAAEFDPSSGGLTIWLSTQTPHRSRRELAGILNINEADLRMIAPDVGGAFGMKASLYPEEVFVARAALALRRSVRWTATRSEDLLSATHGRGGRTSGRLALAADGRFLALKADVICPLGHWLPNSAAIPVWNAARILPGPYDIAAVEISARGVLTNTAPVGIYRGAGRPEAAALMERLVEAAARKTGHDPFDIRKRNMIAPEQMPHAGPTGVVLDSGDYGQAVAILREFAGYDELKRECNVRRDAGETVGLGVAFYIEPCGKGWESARVELHPDGSIVVATGSSTQGHGRETAYARIVADVFEVAPEQVSVLSGDTLTCPEGIGALASRSTAIGGSAVLKAAREVKQNAAREVYRNEPVSSTVIYEADGEAWGYGCHLAVVSIDPETGVIRPEKMFCLDDAGEVVNATLVEGQIVGGIAQGVGEALMENIVYDADGQLLTGSLTDYALPRADNMPDISITTMATPSPFNLLGAKGVGEAGTIGAPAAILNAVHDALAPLGVTEITMPLSSEKIWRAIAAAKQRKSNE